MPPIINKLWCIQIKKAAFYSGFELQISHFFLLVFFFLFVFVCACLVFCVFLFIYFIFTLALLIFTGSVGTGEDH